MEGTGLQEEGRKTITKLSGKCVYAYYMYMWSDLHSFCYIATKQEI